MGAAARSMEFCKY